MLARARSSSVRGFTCRGASNGQSCNFVGALSTGTSTGKASENVTFDCDRAFASERPLALRIFRMFPAALGPPVLAPATSPATSGRASALALRCNGRPRPTKVVGVKSAILPSSDLGSGLAKASPETKPSTSSSCRALASRKQLLAGLFMRWSAKLRGPEQPDACGVAGPTGMCWWSSMRPSSEGCSLPSLHLSASRLQVRFCSRMEWREWPWATDARRCMTLCMGCR